ncbi:apolipoprotein N-acyltransferase [Phytoactinopolyspora endophytica]|uniref:apolipoprotein N-acyltransferase n=1 Tax=Phytoactinopolyspora endophytica TaxID=1642495 RepID=UPI00101E17AD|nr:apolipoprotein N-acyltransferase [Phytoactinopolyspora endophytica]
MSLWVAGQEGRRHFLLRAAGMVIVGLCLALAFPPFDLWFMAALAPGAAALLVRDQPLRRSAIFGFLFGLAFFLPLMWWTGMEVGPIPWILLGILQAAFFIALALGMTLVQRLVGWPIWIAAVWVAVEAFRGRVPWGGLTWGKLAFAQADGPFTGLAALGGTPLVSFAVALVSGLLAWLLVSADTRSRLVAAGAAAAVTLSGLVVSPPAPDGDTITVATVQGNVPSMGLDYNSRARVVTENHVEATEQLARDIQSGQVDQPDLVIWPENSSDIDPFADPAIYEDIDNAVRSIGVPVVISAIIPTDDGQNKENTSILWDPETGPVDTYIKRRPMPFGEYIPMRGIAEMITDAVARQPQDHVAGDEVGVFDTGVASVALAICFEVGFDEIVRDAVVDGGQFLAVQTNNATFRDSPMSEQHLAQSRLRAVEHGRTVIVSALSGISAIINPDGDVEQRTELFTQDVLVSDVQLSDETTLATTVGAWPEWIVVGTGLGAAIAGIVLLRRRPAAEPEPPKEPVPVAAGV